MTLSSCRYLKPYPINIFPTHNVKQQNYNASRREDKVMNKLPMREYFLIMAMFFIYISERDKMALDPINFSIFNILFQVIR